MKNQYSCIKSDPGGGLFVGQVITPYFEDENEIIIAGMQGMNHHIRKNGAYFAEHLELNGG